jgi:hypothetical protein
MAVGTNEGGERLSSVLKRELSRRTEFPESAAKFVEDNWRLLVDGRNQGVIPCLPWSF